MENNLSVRSLETIFLGYSPFWEGWIKQQCNSLLLRDIRLLNARFKYNTTTKYTQVIPNSTIKRLESDLSFYKKWAVAQFKTELKNLFSSGSLSLVYFESIEGLPLDKELIEILKRFGKHTVPQIIDELSESVLSGKLYFENILKFKERLNEIENSNKMKTTALELKKSFACYAPFWEEWLNYSFNTLTIEEIDVINKMVIMGFNIQTHLINESEIELIVVKLKKSHSAYISWAIMKFEFMLIKMFDVDALEDCFETPIKQLSIDKPLKDILLRFGIPTLNLLFEHRNKSKLANG
ncbi:MAG: hypothetical protein IT236_09435, partial [Bacteroidia bacterium]|nr:hypothetical protein [Bacteroidia bacterium]